MDDTPRARFGALVAHTARTWRRAVDRRLQPYGLTEATWLPLVHLARAEKPMRQKELAALLGLDGSSVVRVLDALQAAGMVERREEDGDRRARLLVLTPQGQATVDQVQRVAAAVRDAVLQPLSDADLAQAYALLQRVCDGLDADMRDDA
ncbi:MarR family winged helix-turn-helix transcriptional regulator [Bordetella sp. 2513F-2]